MKVYFDIITNHTADVIGYEEGARTAYVSKDTEPYRTAAGQEFDDRDYAGTNSFPELDPETSFPYTPVLDENEEDLKVPAWLNDTTLYHNRGNTTFTGEDSQYGDFFGLDDLFTENPEVVDGFIDIYRTWVKDFGVDGFRIDTMKHVDDAFWQKFGPGLVDYAKANGKPEFFMFGEVFDQTKSYTSHFTTHDKIQAVLDFPFQDAARNFASRSRGNASLRTFFESDDWYTDADSNVYELPTFLGNHDMGRIGQMIVTDNKDAGDAEWTARDRLAHELMYFSRGNPVVYYGDEQGFTGAEGGDQNARQTLFAEPGRGVPRRRPARHRPHPRTGQLHDLAPALPADQRPRRRDGEAPRAARRRPPDALRLGRGGHRGVLPHRPRGAARVRRRAEQQRAVADRVDPDVLLGRALQEGVRRRSGHRDAPTAAAGSQVTVPPLSAVVYRAGAKVARSKARAVGLAGGAGTGARVARPHARPRRRRGLVVLRGHLRGALGQRGLAARSAPTTPRRTRSSTTPPRCRTGTPLRVPRGGAGQRRAHPPERRALHRRCRRRASGSAVPRTVARSPTSTR